MRRKDKRAAARPHPRGTPSVSGGAPADGETRPAAGLAEAASTALHSLAAPLRRLPPLRLVSRWYVRRPFQTAWGLLAAGMLVLMAIFSTDVGFTLRQYAALSVATILLAGLCTWIIFLEDAEPGDLDGTEQSELPRS